jgi:hypothetical protein
MRMEYNEGNGTEAAPGFACYVTGTDTGIG